MNAQNSKPKARVKPKPELPKDIDSKHELAYLRILEDQHRLQEIRAYYLKPGSLRTGTGVRYEPDFMVITNQGYIEYHEVKGATRFASKGIAKLKMVAHLFPDFCFVLVRGSEIKDKHVLTGKITKRVTFVCEDIS
jgi:hypothetical protein